MKEAVILCVDDEVMVLKSLKRELYETLGDTYLIETAEDGEDALDLFSELITDGYDVPLVISDHIMPKLKGDELLARIHGLSPKTLKIMLTGQADLEAVAHAVNHAKLYRYIAKPWEQADLSLTVKEALRSYFQDQQLEAQNVSLQRMNRELEQLNTAYERFVPREFLGFLEKKSIVDVRLGDQIQKEITILFSDIRSFTTLSEQMTPQENFDFLNAYLGRMGPVIRRHRGFIDKYIGDGVMAIFPEHAADAINAALDMRRELAAYNAERSRRQLAPIQIGIGLHIGNVMLGTIGEEQRMDTTVIADAVNLAARLEGLTKTYGTTLIVSEPILARLAPQAQYHTRFLGQAQVKGKKEAVAVFEIFDGDPEPVHALKLTTKTDFETGLAYYGVQDFDRAAQTFRHVLRRNPQDLPAKLLLERSVRFMRQAATEAWQPGDVET